MATELNPETILARSGLLDALHALGTHRESVVLVGAQAIYLRTGTAAVALAEFTTDADLAIDPRRLESAPLLEAVLTEGGLMRDPRNSNPGAWLSGRGVPIDVMVPAAVAGLEDGAWPFLHTTAVRCAKPSDLRPRSSTTRS